VPIGWRIVGASVRAGDGSTREWAPAAHAAPELNLEQFAQFEDLCAVGDSATITLREVEPAATTAESRMRAAEANTVQLLCLLAAVALPGALILLPEIWPALADSEGAATCTLWGSGADSDAGDGSGELVVEAGSSATFEYCTHGAMVASMLFVSMAKRFSDRGGSRRRRAPVWRCDIAQAAGFVVMMHAANTWLAVHMDARSREQIGRCAGSRIGVDERSCAHHAGTWQPAGSDACGWYVINWAVDLLLRQSLVYAAVVGLERMENEGATDCCTFGSYGAERSGRCSVYARGISQLLGWLLLVGCAKCAVAALTVLALAHLQPLAALLADATAAGHLSPQVALMVAVLALPTVPNALQLWWWDSYLDRRRWRRVALQNRFFSRALALRQSKGMLFDHKWSRFARRMLDKHRLELQNRSREARFPGRPLARPAGPPPGLSYGQGAALLGRSE
jgi:hypothetical protein